MRNFRARKVEAKEKTFSSQGQQFQCQQQIFQIETNPYNPSLFAQEKRLNPLHEHQRLRIRRAKLSN